MIQWKRKERSSWLNYFKIKKKQMWYTYKMEYYSAVKKNEIMPFAATWMDLEIIILSKVSQKEKKKHLITALYVESKKT